MVLIWLSPLVLFLGLILSGRSALTAGAFGTACAALVAFLAGPARPDAMQIALHFAAGAWIGLPAVLVIVGRAGLDRALLLRLMPYAALVAALALMRLVPAVHDRLASPSFRPFADAAAFAPLLSPALPLLAIALAVAAARGGARQAGRLLRLSLQRAWRAALLTFLLVGMAWIMVGAGLAGGIGLAVSAVIGPWSAAVVPVAGALGGYFTGSNTGAGAVAMPLATALVPGAQAKLAVIATAVVAGSLMTAVSPLRVTMGQILVGASAAETGAALRALWPWFALVAGLTTALALLAARLLA